jgi:hypothetical protein
MSRKPLPEEVGDLRAALRQGDPGAGEGLTAAEVAALRRSLLAAVRGAAGPAEQRPRWVVAAAAAVVLAAAVSSLVWLWPHAVEEGRRGGVQSAAALAAASARTAPRRPRSGGGPGAAVAVAARRDAARPRSRGRGPAARLGPGTVQHEPAAMRREELAAIGRQAPAAMRREEPTSIDPRVAEMPTTLERAVARAAPGATAPAALRQVQFATRGGTRIIWIMRGPDAG